jgi:hypothetical protein
VESAVREGRRIAGNIRSFLAFLLSANVGEVVLYRSRDPRRARCADDGGSGAHGEPPHGRAAGYRPRALAAVLGSLAFLLATIYIPALHDPFGTVSLASGEPGIVLALALLPVLASESLKAVVRLRVG